MFLLYADCTMHREGQGERAVLLPCYRRCGCRGSRRRSSGRRCSVPQCAQPPRRHVAVEPPVLQASQPTGGKEEPGGALGVVLQAPSPRSEPRHRCPDFFGGGGHRGLLSRSEGEPPTRCISRRIGVEASDGSEVTFVLQALGDGEYLQDGEVGKIVLWHPVQQAEVRPLLIVFA